MKITSSPGAVKRALRVHEHHGHLPARPARLDQEDPGPHEDAGGVPVRPSPPVEALERAVVAPQPGVLGDLVADGAALGVEVVEVAEEEVQQERLAATEGAWKKMLMPSLSVRESRSFTCHRDDADGLVLDPLVPGEHLVEGCLVQLEGVVLLVDLDDLHGALGGEGGGLFALRRHLGGGVEPGAAEGVGCVVKEEPLEPKFCEVHSFFFFQFPFTSFASCQTSMREMPVSEAIREQKDKFH